MDFWMIVLNIVVFVLVLGIIVLIHELGHFLVARKVDILCYEFSLGMGPTIYKKKKGETVYALKALPIGGSVSMAGEDLNEAMIRKDQTISINIDNKGEIKDIIIDNAINGTITGRVVDFDLYGKNLSPLFIELEVNDELIKFNVLRNASYFFGRKEIQIAPQEKSFESKKIWQRLLVIAAGPLMNFVLAFFLLLIVGFVNGKPQTQTATIGSLTSGYPATDFLKDGDIITHIEGLEVNTWDNVGEILYDFSGKSDITITYTRDGVPAQGLLTPLVDIRSASISNFNDEGKIMQGTIIGQAYGNSKDHLVSGDEILAIWNGDEFHSVNNWEDIVDVFKAYDNKEIKMKIARDGAELGNDVIYDGWSEEVLSSQQVEKIATIIGISPVYTFDFLYSFEYAGIQFWNNATQIFKTLGLLFTGKVPVSNLSGPVGIFNLVGQVMTGGIIAIIAFMAFLSVNVGILNLLPIPALDGGRILFLLIEAVIRRPINKRVENMVNNIMFILLLAFIVFITVMDILRLF